MLVSLEDVGTFMKPHFDVIMFITPDIFAAMLYLNNNFLVDTLVLKILK